MNVIKTAVEHVAGRVKVIAGTGANNTHEAIYLAQEAQQAGNISRACYLFKHAPKNFAVYSGDDPTALAFLLCGGHGVISVAANVAPKMFADMCHAALRGDITGARALNDKLQRLHGDLFCEPSPAPTKWALSKLGKINPVCRLPITELTPAGQTVVLAAMQEAGLI